MGLVDEGCVSGRRRSEWTCGPCFRALRQGLLLDELIWRVRRVAPWAIAYTAFRAWVALPIEDEEAASAFLHHSGDDLHSWRGAARRGAGVQGHLIAGSAYGLVAGARTHSPMFYAHLELEEGAVAEIPASHSERAAYVARGEIEIGGSPIASGQMAVLSRGASFMRAVRPSTIMVLGGVGSAQSPARAPSRGGNIGEKRVFATSLTAVSHAPCRFAP